MSKATKTLGHPADLRTLESKLALSSMIESARTGTGPCPACGSSRKPIRTDGDEVFLPRYGCLDCNTWWSLPQLRNVP